MYSYLMEDLKNEISLKEIANKYCFNNEKRVGELIRNLQNMGVSINKKYDIEGNIFYKLNYNEKFEDIYIDGIDDYLFVLDGVGVVQYIKEKYGDTLPIEMLTRSNVSSSAFYYSGYGVDYSILGEGHLFSLYRKFVKYYPDKVEEFISLVNSIDLITPTEFVNNYMIFVRNGLNSNFMLKKGNISIEGLDGNKRDALGPISLFSLFDSRESKDAEYSRKLEKDHSDRIKKDFEKMVNDYNESIGSAMVLTIKPNNNGN